MQNLWSVYFVLFVAVFLLYIPQKKRRRYVADRHIVKNRIINHKRRIVMKELVQRFIGKDVYIKLLEGTADGVVTEVTDNGVVLDNNGKLQVVNLDYVMKVREYPHKNGKRATIWGE